MKTTTSQIDKSAFKHWTHDVVRYRDLDPNAHVNNSVYSTFFESGRVNILKRLDSFYEQNFETALVHLSIDFMKELRLGAAIDIGMTIERIGNSSMKIKSAIFEGNDCNALSTAIIVLFDKEKRQSTPWPDSLKEQIKLLL